jgi:hypothetical protein
MSQIGIPELVLVLGLSVFSLFPIIAGVWALWMLYRLRLGQDELRRRLDAIERLLHHTEE